MSITYTRITESGRPDDFDNEIQYIKGFPGKNGNETDKKFFRDNAREYYDFLNKSYLRATGEQFGGFRNYDNFKRNASMFIAVYCNDILIALTVYTDYLKGQKCVGLSCYLREDNLVLHDLGIKALYNIIRDNTENFKEWVWAEASDGPEQMYNNVNAPALPVEIAYDVMGRPEVFIPEPDGFHYLRATQMKTQTGTLISNGLLKKIIYGFNSEETYEKYVEYQNARIIKEINEDTSEINEAVRYRGYSRTDLEHRKLSKLLVYVNIYREDYVSPFLKELISKQLTLLQNHYNPNDHNIEWSTHMAIKTSIDEAKHILIMPLTPKPKNFVESLREVGVL